MISPRGLVVLIIAASLTLVGCSSPTSEEPPSSTKGSSVEPSSEPTTAPATGDRLSGSGYSYSVPEGWAEQANPQADTVALDMTDTDGFADNVNVVVSKSGTATPDQLEAATVTQWEDAGATDVTLNDRIDVAGTESAHVSAVLSANGSSYQIEQYYIGADDQTFIVTFSFSITVSEADRDALAESVLASWEWA